MLEQVPDQLYATRLLLSAQWVPAEPQKLPYIPSLLYTYTAVSCTFLLLLSVGGVLMLASRSAGIWISIVTYGSEILYYIITSLVLHHASYKGQPHLANRLWTTDTLGNIGLAPQEITLFPVIALVLIAFVWYVGGKESPVGQPSNLNFWAD